MAETITLLAFAAMLFGCVVTGTAVFYALAGGLAAFSIYTLYRGYSPVQLAGMIGKGIKNARTILMVFVLIGCLTALWRACGTIPCIVYYSASSMPARYYLVLTFLLCCGMSALTGTSFGTVSTMGVICASIGRAMGVPMVYIGGAVMSGIYFGEHCSPMSSIALFICDLTGSNIYRIISKMLREIWLPMVLSAGLYLVLGRGLGQGAAGSAEIQMFAEAFPMNGFLLIPAAVIVGFSLLRVRVEYAMLVSILTAAALCVSVQGMGLGELAGVMVWGYHAHRSELAALIDGGGLVSMVDVAVIVTISSAYFGIFRTTGLLSRLKDWMERLAAHSYVFAATFAVSIVACAISCNQVLAAMITGEMTGDLVADKEELAVNLESTVVVIAALIPWSIASAFPRSVLGAPVECLLYASYLYLTPLCRLVKQGLFPRGRACIGSQSMLQSVKNKENQM